MAGYWLPDMNWLGLLMMPFLLDLRPMACDTAPAESVIVVVTDDTTFVTLVR